MKTLPLQWRLRARALAQQWLGQRRGSWAPEQCALTRWCGCPHCLLARACLGTVILAGDGASWRTGCHAQMKAPPTPRGACPPHQLHFPGFSGVWETCSGGLYAFGPLESLWRPHMEQILWLCFSFNDFLRFFVCWAYLNASLPDISF